jgi:hypothetical protein
MGKRSKRTEKLNLPLTIEPAESSDRLEVRRTAKLYIGGAFPRSESGRSQEVQLAKGGVANIARGSRKDLREAVRVRESPPSRGPHAPQWCAGRSSIALPN